MSGVQPMSVGSGFPMKDKQNLSCHRLWSQMQPVHTNGTAATQKMSNYALFWRKCQMFLPSSDPLITKPQKWNLHKVFCSNQGFLSYIAFVVIVVFVFVVVVVFVDALVVVIENRKSGIQTEFSSLIRDLIRDELCIHRPDRRGAKLPSNLQIEFFSSCHPQSLTNPQSSNTPYFCRCFQYRSGSTPYFLKEQYTVKVVCLQTQ